jgi:hypothetical protein
MIKRRIAIAVGAVVLVAGVVAGRERPSLELVEARSQAPVASDGIDLGKLRRGESTLPETDPFKRFEVLKEKTSKQAAVEKPTAPALPFQYFGRLTENGKTDVFVMRGDELLAVAPGQKLGDYRVDAIGDSSISFTYLPLKTKQTLDFAQ